MQDKDVLGESGYCASYIGTRSSDIDVGFQHYALAICYFAISSK
jgi:hypothetical protein